MRIIICNCKRHILVEEDVFDSLSPFEWHCSNGAVHRNERRDGVLVSIVMADVINPPPVGMMNDHIDRDDHNNLRSNLRFATKLQNNWNQGVRKSNTSGYKGVTFHKPTGKWRARIRADSDSLSLGLFATPQLAAQAYNEVAKRLHGEFAYQNQL